MKKNNKTPPPATPNDWEGDGDGDSKFGFHHPHGTRELIETLQTMGTKIDALPLDGESPNEDILELFGGVGSIEEGTADDADLGDFEEGIEDDEYESGTDDADGPSSDEEVDPMLELTFNTWLGDLQTAMVLMQGIDRNAAEGVADALETSGKVEAFDDMLNEVNAPHTWRVLRRRMEFRLRTYLLALRAEILADVCDEKP